MYVGNSTHYFIHMDFSALPPGGSRRRGEDLAASDAHHAAQQRPGAAAGPVESPAVMAGNAILGGY